MSAPSSLDWAGFSQEDREDQVGNVQQVQRTPRNMPSSGPQEVGIFSSLGILISNAIFDKQPDLPYFLSQIFKKYDLEFKAFNADTVFHS